LYHTPFIAAGISEKGHKNTLLDFFSRV